MLLLLLLLRSPLLAQDDPSPFTFHVYANLIQVPVLVLSDARKPLPPIEPQRFTLSLDSGRPFRPTHVRVEGDDPLDLSILLDLHNIDRDFLKRLPEALEAMVALSLHPQDRVTLYVLNCNLVRYAGGVSGNPTSLKTQTEASLQALGVKPAARCANPVQLWDALSMVANRAASLPSRPVLLAVTGGTDPGDSARWLNARESSGRKSLAIFTLKEDIYAAVRDPREDALTAICELSGGMVLRASSSKLTETLLHFVATLRDRYIISFPRPDTLQAGPPVELTVNLLKQHAFIRPAGIQVPVPDAKLLADPNTLRNDPAHAPEIGARRILAPPE